MEGGKSENLCFRNWGGFAKFCDLEREFYNALQLERNMYIARMAALPMASMK